ANAVKNAIRVAAGLAKSHMNEKIEEELSLVSQWPVTETGAVGRRRKDNAETQRTLRLAEEKSRFLAPQTSLGMTGDAGRWGKRRREELWEKWRLYFRGRLRNTREWEKNWRENTPWRAPFLKKRTRRWDFPFRRCASRARKKN